MSTVDPRECQALADLARLSLSQEEAQDFAGQLGRILSYIEQLSGVTVEGVPEYLSAARSDSALRPDVPGPTLDRDAALAAAPQREGDLVAVPKFRED